MDSDQEQKEWEEKLQAFKERMLKMRAREDPNKKPDQAEIEAARESLGLKRPHFKKVTPILMDGEPMSEMIIRDRG
jgi:DNA-binding transcriptional regulator YiaG